MRRDSNGGYRLDEIDRRIIYDLMVDSRNTSAPMIADEVNVSPATVRNRIKSLEKNGIIKGYSMNVDFERAEGYLTNLFLCHVDFNEVQRVTQKAASISGVINVRELMGGRRNLHVLAVGKDTSELRRIGGELSDLGLEIEDEMILQNDEWHPYTPFGPGDGEQRSSFTDLINLAGGADVIEVTVDESSEIAGKTLEEAVNEGLIRDETLVIAVERGDEMVTPNGSTVIQADDIVTVFSRDGADEELIRTFREDSTTVE